MPTLFPPKHPPRKTQTSPPSGLNDLTGSEWTLHAKSVQKFDSPIAAKRKTHGAAFPPALAKHFIEIYTQTGDTVFDPFAGVGTTLDAANQLERHAIGIELNPTFIRLYENGIDPKDGILNPHYRRTMIHDSTLNAAHHIAPNTADMLLTSPPYAGLLNHIRQKFADKDYAGNPYKNQSRQLARPYSTHAEDLGNAAYPDFLTKMERLFAIHHAIIKPGGYNAWVVRDYRDAKNGIPYVNLHGDITAIAQKTGWIMWDMVIWNQSDQRKLVRLGGNRSRRYYFNIGHSFILIFRKNMAGETFK